MRKTSPYGIQANNQFQLKNEYVSDWMQRIRKSRKKMAIMETAKSNIVIGLYILRVKTISSFLYVKLFHS